MVLSSEILSLTFQGRKTDSTHLLIIRITITTQYRPQQAMAKTQK
jgi:hypothetical protein